MIRVEKCDVTAESANSSLEEKNEVEEKIEEPPSPKKWKGVETNGNHDDTTHEEAVEQRTSRKVVKKVEIEVRSSKTCLFSSSK